jgi:hypothetical protein
MSETVVQCHFTFNAEHNKLLDQLRSKTGKDKREIIRDAIKLALQKELKPARYRWIDKNHRIFSVDLPIEDAQNAKKRWKGKLTPLVVSGIIEIARNEGIGVTEAKPTVTQEDILRLRGEFREISNNLQALVQRISYEEVPKEITDSASAAKAVRATLKQLSEQLEHFKKGTAADRKQFRKFVDPLEAGYVTSILKALFDEDEFQRWVLATEFTGRRRTYD